MNDAIYKNGYPSACPDKMEQCVVVIRKFIRRYFDLQKITKKPLLGFFIEKGDRVTKRR